MAQISKQDREKYLKMLSDKNEMQTIFDWAERIAKSAAKNYIKIPAPEGESMQNFMLREYLTNQERSFYVLGWKQAIRWVAYLSGGNKHFEITSIDF